MSDTGNQQQQQGAATVPGAGGNGAAPPWYAAFDEDQRGWLQTRGLDKKTAPEAVQQLSKDFRETQSKLGIPADRVLRLPDLTDKDALKAVFQKLGAPPEPAGYDFAGVKFADGSELDDELVGFLRNTAAAHSLTKDAARGIAEALVRFTGETQAAETMREGAALAAARQELATSWGANAENNHFVANRTAGLLGFDADFVASLPADRYAPFMQKMLEAGARMGEAPLLGSGGSSGGAGPRVMTREGAVARINDLINDKEWFKRFHAGGKAEIEEWGQLNRLAASPAPR